LHVANDDARTLGGKANNGSRKCLKNEGEWNQYFSLDGMLTLFSAFRRSFFLPISYIRRAFPTPATKRPWNAMTARGTSSVSVYTISSAK
jgi:hypothetical protein